MQDRYVGDVGDFVKFGILRALAGDHSVGVAWWLHPDEMHNGDGRHVTYLQRANWRDLDQPLFDALNDIVQRDARNVAALETARLLTNATYAREQIPTAGPAAARRLARSAWIERTHDHLAGTDLVFVDPDNGLETSRFSPAARRAAKCVALAELRALAQPGRTLLVYHHQTRRPGGHEAELRHWGQRLSAAGFRQVDAIRARPYSPRAFFLIDAPQVMRDRAADLCLRWHELLSWRPNLQGANATSARAA
jgi:hypothetical protein